MQCQDGHISTCLIKTLVNYLCCAYCALCQLLFVICLSLSLFIIFARYSTLSLIYFVHCSTFHPRCGSIRFFSILLFSSFFVHCSREKSLILILDCVPGISILRTTSSMRVNKNHTADCTDFVLV